MLFVAFATHDSVGAYLPCQWAGRRSNPRLRFFRPPLDRLSYQPMLACCWRCPIRTQKKARCLGDTVPSFWKAVRLKRVSREQSIRGITGLERMGTVFIHTAPIATAEGNSLV